MNAITVRYFLRKKITCIYFANCNRQATSRKAFVKYFLLGTSKVSYDILIRNSSLRISCIIVLALKGDTNGYWKFWNDVNYRNEFYLYLNLRSYIEILWWLYLHTVPFHKVTSLNQFSFLLDETQVRLWLKLSSLW